MNGLTQVCLVVDGDRYDMSLPAARPVVELLADLLVATGRWGGDPRRWVLRPVGTAGPLPPHWTLDDARVRDGAVVLLEPDGAAAEARQRVVDNLPGTVAEVVATRAGRIDRDAVSGLLGVLGCLALVAPALAAPAAGPAGGVLSALVALVLTVVAAAADERQPAVAAVAAPGAALHAALSAGASTDAVALDVRLAFALAAGGAVASALAAVVDGPAVRAGLVGVGVAALTGAALAGVAAALHWPAGVTGLVAVLVALVVLAGAGQFGFRAARVPQLDRVTPTEEAVRERVGLGRLLVSSAHLAAAALAVAGSALVFSGDDARRWAVAGLVALILVVRTRACAELGQLLPLAVGVALVVVAFAAEVVGPRAGWAAVYLGGAAAGGVLLALARRRPPLRPLVRRRLGRVELALALACVPAVLAATDVLSAALEAGRGVL